MVTRLTVCYADDANGVSLSYMVVKESTSKELSIVGVGAENEYAAWIVVHSKPIKRWGGGRSALV
jgi:hypothetical protein